MKNASKLLGYYNYTVVLTYLGMITGYLGIVCAFTGETTQAVVCLMIAGLCDMFDGTIASTRKRTSAERCFGIQIDSLSDLICFGVLPAAIVVSGNPESTLVLGLSALYLLCALIRLAYFNVDEQERQQSESSSREIYYGLPVTLSALFLPLCYAMGTLWGWNNQANLTALLGVMSVLFLAPFPLKKPRLIGKLCVVLWGIFEILLVLFACLDV